MNNFYSLGLLGFPLDHSFSLYIHNAALSEFGLEGEYILYSIPLFPMGEKEFCALLLEVRKGNIAGLNITLPYKQVVIPFLDELTSEAKNIGAVNTIYCRNEKLIGDNTDVYGFMTDLSQKLEKAYQLNLLKTNAIRHALVLGAGGAARAVVVGLLLACWKVTIAARREQQAADLAKDLQPIVDYDRINTLALNRTSINSILKEISLVVNATPVGQWPNVLESPWPEDLFIPQGTMVYDLIYNPRETKFVQEARTQGLYASGGLGMLVEQAALSFAKWTGYFPSTSFLYKEVIAHIQ